MLDITLFAEKNNSLIAINMVTSWFTTRKIENAKSVPAPMELWGVFKIINKSVCYSIGPTHHGAKNISIWKKSFLESKRQSKTYRAYPKLATKLSSIQKEP